jgi:hypothetical protein
MDAAGVGGTVAGKPGEHGLEDLVAAWGGRSVI